MCQDYSAAALLIEFTADRAFLLQSASDIKEQMELNNICSKMALLAIAFPKLRILWTRDPHRTGRPKFL